MPNFGGDHHGWVGPVATSLTALSGPMTPHVEGPSRAHEGALWLYAAPPRAPASDACSCSGPVALNQQRAFALRWPIGPLAGACEAQYQVIATAWPLGALATTSRGFLVLVCCGRRPRAHSQRASPAPAPCNWGLRAWPCCRAWAWPGMCTRPPGETRPPSRPTAAPQRRLPRARTRGTARPSAAAAVNSTPPSGSDVF